MAIKNHELMFFNLFDILHFTYKLQEKSCPPDLEDYLWTQIIIIKLKEYI